MTQQSDTNGVWEIVHDGPSWGMLKSPDGRIFGLQEFGGIGSRPDSPWATPIDNEELCKVFLRAITAQRPSSEQTNPLGLEAVPVAPGSRFYDLRGSSEPSSTATNDGYYRNALDKAAYALFQLKRFADMPLHAIDFCREQHALACKALDDMPLTAQPSAMATTSDDSRDGRRYRWLQQQPCRQDGTPASESCYLDLNPRDMDAAIDAAMSATRDGGADGK